MSTPEDPYFTGRIFADVESPERPGDRTRAFAFAGWMAVYVTNLVVPLFFGRGATNGAGKLGMLVAILVLLALGYRARSTPHRVGKTLFVGGWIVAGSQIFPVLQIIAGMVGMTVARVMGQATMRGPWMDLDSGLGGFIATFVTGGILMGVASAIGLVIRWIYSYKNPVKHG